MSASYVKKALELVDPEFKVNSKEKKVSSRKKLSVTEAKKSIKSHDKILRDNLAKIKKIRDVCKVELDKETTRQIIQRGVTKRPVRTIKPKRKEQQNTVFTEEDFKKFEEEYQG